MSALIPVTIVYPAPSPHAVDLFNAIHHNGAFEVEALFCLPEFASRAGWPVPKVDFPAEHLAARRLWARNEFAVWNRDLVGRVRAGVRAGRIHLVSGGYTMPSVALAMIALNRMRAKWYFLSEPPGLSTHPVKSFLRNRLIKTTLGRCTGILAHGPLAVKAYHALGFQPSRVHDLPYYMNVDEFLQIERTWEGIATRPLRILFCGQLDERKGIDWALRVVAGMKDLDGRFTLDIAGEGPLRTSLEEFARSRSLKNVQFLGPVAWGERPNLYKDHDLLLLPSVFDGWGMVVMEALASGMPVIGTRTCGAIEEYVREGVCGRKFNHGDDRALQEALRECINDPPGVARMGKAARPAIAEWRPRIGAARLLQIIRQDESGH